MKGILIMKMLTENGERTELFKLDEEEERTGAIVRWRKDIYYLWTILPGITSAIVTKSKLDEETAVRIISNVNKSSSASSSESEKDWNAKVKKEYYGYPEIIREILSGDDQLYRFMDQLSKNEELMLSHYSLFSYMAEIIESDKKNIKKETKRLFKSKMSLMQKIQDFNEVWNGMLKKNSLSENIIIPLKELPIKRELNEDTRLQGVYFGGVVFSLHKHGDEYLITDNEDYNKIYQITSCGFWSLDYGVEKENEL